MVVKLSSGNPEILEARWQGEEHMAKAELFESQTESGESTHCSYRTRGSFPMAFVLSDCANVKHPWDDAGNKPDNGRTGRLRARNQCCTRTTGSSKQAAKPAWRRSFHSIQGVGLTSDAASAELDAKNA